MAGSFSWSVRGKTPSRLAPTRPLCSSAPCRAPAPEAGLRFLYIQDQHSALSIPI